MSSVLIRVIAEPVDVGSNQDPSESAMVVCTLAGETIMQTLKALRYQLPYDYPEPGSIIPTQGDVKSAFAQQAAMGGGLGSVFGSVWPSRGK